ncbi:MAG: hypothetical protein Faunusvirus38_1, partial [Faunusvirus sp.]
MISKLTALVKVGKDKAYDYMFAHKADVGTVERMNVSATYYDQVTSMISCYWSSLHEPTYIIDNLYIGSAVNAASYDELKRLNIQIIMNVT